MSVARLLTIADVVVIEMAIGEFFLYVLKNYLLTWRTSCADCYYVV